MPIGGLVTAGLVIGGVQAATGAYQAISGNAAKKKALKERKPYQTPQEIIDILNLTEGNAQLGFDPTTLAYLTNQTDRAFSGALNTAEKLGADPNDLSAIFDQKIQGLMKIGAQNHALNMENFNKYLGALQGVADNKAAEQKSQQDIVKDKLQSAAAEIQTGTANISKGLSTGISAYSSGLTSDLYKENVSLKKQLEMISTGTSGGGFKYPSNQNQPVIF